MLWARVSEENKGAAGDLVLQAPTLAEKALPSQALLHVTLPAALPAQSLVDPPC